MIKKLLTISAMIASFYVNAQKEVAVQKVSFSPATANETSFSYDFGEAIQDTAGGKYHKDVTFTIAGFDATDSYSTAFSWSAATTTNANCTSSENQPFTILSSTSSSFTVRFNPRAFALQQEYVSESICFTDPKTGKMTCSKGGVYCGPNGFYSTNYGDKTATLTITRQPFCPDVIIVEEFEEAKPAPIVDVCPPSTNYTITLTGKSVEKLTNTSIISAQNTIITAYPNPVNDVLNFEGKGELYTMNGQLVGEGTNQINVSDLNQGMYVLKTVFGMTKIVKE